MQVLTHVTNWKFLGVFKYEMYFKSRCGSIMEVRFQIRVQVKFFMFLFGCHKPYYIYKRVKRKKVQTCKYANVEKNVAYDNDIY